MSAHSDVWPAGQPHLKPIITTCYLLSVAVLSALLSRRLISFKQMKRLPIAKLLVIAVLGDSLLFVFASAVLILGVGTSFSSAACSLGIWWCIILYVSSKVLIYSFLSEKLYAVYSITPTRRVSRWESTQYKIAMAFLLAWMGVAIVMIIGRIAEIRERDNACIIGLKLYATVPMLTVDAIVNIYLTGAFVIPVYRSRWHKAQKLALHSSIAAVASLVTSFANIAVLTFEHGHQLSWVCLGSCGLDVSLNAIILYLVTASSSSSSTSAEDYTANHVHTNKNHVSVLRSTGPAMTGGGVGAISQNRRQFETSFLAADADEESTLPPIHHDLRPTFGKLESDATFEEKYDLDPVSTNELAEVAKPISSCPSPCASPSPRFPTSTSSPHPSRSSSPDRSKSRSTTTTIGGGVHVSEEIVTVAERVSCDELREEEEWLRRGRQSRIGSQSAGGGGKR
ncbi:uncharacterized protein JCM6883_002137 [Sporobolomyces salmoneus]|uniref:uncharacterized protein n=1 Tax=Sporobolomyces salmoneus TaxID=183962 RepID=UPI003173C7B7